MASPLTPSNSAALNVATPPTSHRLDSIDMQQDTVNNDNANSSPFISQLNEDGISLNHTQENASRAKSRHSRILSGTELSPLKILNAKDSSIEQKQPSPLKSPRKISPEKRFPVKVNNGRTPSPEMPAVQEREITLEEALRQNEGLANAIKVFEDEDTMLENVEEEADVTSMTVDDPPIDEEPSGPDDTMVSTFSNFSAVPNMTMFARIGHSPTRFANVGATPTAARGRPEHSPSRTPRPPVMHESGNTTNLLMDFTEQMSGFSSRHPQQTPNRNGRLSPSKTMGNLTAATPQRHQSNLLDFDIPPLPTPRSIPTITPRELESLKSNFLSEISSLKASLSGKEAEVLSLKTAVGDAEKRVGECMEELREIRTLKDTLTDERDNWEKRGREMETVLRKAKEEIVMGQREQEELESKLDESEKRREAAEIMAQEAESKMAGMRAGKATSDSASDGGNNKSPEKAKSPGSREVEIAVERVARELHALYKSKHETKVAALKKSYENRWEKKVRELESSVADLVEENEKLKLGRDATITKVDPNQSVVDEERKAQAVKDSTQIKELNAEIEKLEAVVKSVKVDNNELRHLLEKERVEKGELVSLAEEMMSMQQSFVQTRESTPAPAPAPARTPAPSRPSVANAQAPADNYRTSAGRTSGLRAPGSVKKPTQSRIGGIAHERNKNGGSHSGLARPGSGMGMRSGIMSSIEKMGNYRGRAE
ncbi:hypothetical protein F5B20DRAFT_520317 [Whalleya microplaca]|nr:hypothetical protein F5B20DRAFT_520317 [Whalleya microplaca]